jgi:hypothetical protein
MRRGSDRKKIGPLEVFLLVVLVFLGYLKLTEDPYAGQKRELQKLQTLQAQPAPQWWAETQTAVWSWSAPTPVGTPALSHTPTPTATLGVSPVPGVAPVSTRRATRTGVEKRAEDDD